MTITARVPIPIDWDDVTPGVLLQAGYCGRPVLCVRMDGDRGQVAVLRSSDWKTLPSVAPVDTFDPHPLVLPGPFVVEAVPGDGGTYDGIHEVANGNLRVMSDGRAAIVVVGPSGTGGYVVPLGVRTPGGSPGKHPVDFEWWRIIEVDEGQPRSAGRVVFEKGAPKPEEPPHGGAETFAEG